MHAPVRIRFHGPKLYLCTCTKPTKQIHAVQPTTKFVPYVESVSVCARMRGRFSEDSWPPASHTYGPGQRAATQVVGFWAQKLV